MKEFTIEVFKAGQAETATEHVVQVTVKEDGREIGVAQLPGGSYENAKSMAEGLKAMADAGIDLTAMMPDAGVEK